MTQLVQALRELGVDAEVSATGRWARIEGGRCAVYVAEASHRRGFLVWCDAPGERAVDYHATAAAAVRAGLLRVSRVATKRGGQCDA